MPNRILTKDEVALKVAGWRSSFSLHEGDVIKYRDHYGQEYTVVLGPRTVHPDDKKESPDDKKESS